MKGANIEKLAEKWFHTGKELEIVNGYKYLDCWFITKHSFSLHVKKMALKKQMAVNAVWGV